MVVSLIIGVTGGSGSGKTHIISELLKNFKSGEVCLVSQDNYYKKIEHQPLDKNGIENFDLPESIDEESLFQDIVSLKKGKEVRIIEYTFNNSKTNPKTIIIKPAPVIIVEGILVFYWKRVRAFFDLSVFIEANDLIKVKRRIIRDAKERGYDLEDVLYRYEHHVTPIYENKVRPLKAEMDLIIPNNTDFKKGLDVLSTYIRNHLNSQLRI